MRKNMWSIFLHPQGTGHSLLAWSKRKEGEKALSIVIKPPRRTKEMLCFLHNGVSKQMHEKPQMSHLLDASSPFVWQLREAESTCPVHDPGVVCSAWEGSSRCRAHLHGECSTGCSPALPSWLCSACNTNKVFLDQPKFLLSEQIQERKYTKKFVSICIVKPITPAQS